MRQDDLFRGDLIIFNLVHNFLCIGNCLGILCEKVCHFLLCLQEFLPGIMHARCIVEVPSGIEANKDTVSFIISCVYIMHIISGDQFNIMFSGQLHKDFIHHFLLRMPMVLQFQVKISPKDLKEFQQHCFCLFLPVHPYNGWNLPAQAGRRRDQSLAILTKQFFINTRCIINPIFGGANIRIFFGIKKK